MKDQRCHICTFLLIAQCAPVCFQPENDFDNYRRYKLLGPPVKVSAKKGVLPHKFECQRDRPHIKPRPSSMRRLKRAAVHDLTQMGLDSKVST